MGGRFGKYGDAKCEAQIRKNRLGPLVSREVERDQQGLSGTIPA